MKRYLWLVGVLLAMLPAAALAQQATGVDITGDILGTIKEIFSSFRAGSYLPVISGVIVVILYAWRRWFSGLLLNKITNAWWLSFIPMVMALLASASTGLLVTPFDWRRFVVDTFVTGAQAIAIWQLLGKVVLSKVGLIEKMKAGEASAGSIWV